MDGAQCALRRRIRLSLSWLSGSRCRPAGRARALLGGSSQRSSSHGQRAVRRQVAWHWISSAALTAVGSTWHTLLQASKNLLPVQQPGPRSRLCGRRRGRGSEGEFAGKAQQWLQLPTAPHQPRTLAVNGSSPKCTSHTHTSGGCSWLSDTRSADPRHRGPRPSLPAGPSGVGEG